MPIDVSGYNVAPTQNVPLQGLDFLANSIWRNREFAYRQAQDQKMQEWRKANLINSLTDLNDYKTGSDVADAVGNHLMSNIADKYNGMAANMSPLELEGGIKKDMAGVITGMNGIKDELGASDKLMQVLKQAYPDLNTADLYDLVRKDIVHRHLNADGSDFDSPVNIANKQPSFDLSDPNFLSRYLKTTGGLDKTINDRTGLEDQPVYVGNDLQNQQWKTKIPFYMQPNFDATKFSKSGYLPQGFTPQLSIKSQSIPTEYLPALGNQDRQMVTDDVYQKFKASNQLYVIKGTRDMFPTYDSFNENEKEIAERDFLYKYLSNSSLPQYAQFHEQRPPASIMKFDMGIPSGKGGGGEPTINDVYGKVVGAMDDDVNSTPEGKIPYTRISKLDASTQPIVVKLAKDVAEQQGTGGTKIDQSNIYLRYNKDGKPAIYLIGDSNQPTPNDREIVPLDYTGTNIKAQPNVKGKVEVIQQGKQQTNAHPLPQGKPRTVKQNGYTYTWNEQTGQYE